MEWRKLITVGVVVILIAGLLLTGFYHIGNYLIITADQKMNDQRDRMVAEMNKMVDRAIEKWDQRFIDSLTDPKVQKAVDEFLYRMYYSDTIGQIKAQINGKINHVIWTFLGAVEGVYGLRPAYVDLLEQLYGKDQYFPVDAGASVAPSQYKFRFVEGAAAGKEVKVETEAVAPKTEAEAETEEVKPPAEGVVEGAPAEKVEETTPKETLTPAPAPPDDSAMEETKKLLEGM